MRLHEARSIFNQEVIKEIIQDIKMIDLFERIYWV